MWILAVIVVIAGCAAQHPKQTPLAKAQTEIPNAIPARFNKASLVGCWDWLQEGNGIGWLCFDKESHYAIVVAYDDEGRDNVGRYNVTANGYLIFDKEDEILGTRKLKISAHNYSKISLNGIANSNDPIFMSLIKDSKNDFYKEISKTYF